MGEKPYKHLTLIISVCLVAAIVAVYWPVYSYDFVKYDDDTYVTENTNIQSGLNFKSIRWAFTATYASNWHPLTWLSHMLDCQLFGDWAGGHHLVNVLLHILNTLLLLGVLMRMTGDVWPSAFVAALFALHPLHVESVAWVAERKDVLSTFFALLTMWAYSYYVSNLKLKWYIPAFILFVLGLMSKPMLVTLPFVLLLLDYWPLERKISLRLLLEKIPFFICSLISSVITFLVQRGSGTMASIESFGLKTRINNVIVSYIMYIVKMFWPSNLAVLYPHPGNNVSITNVIICGLLFTLLSFYLIYKARQYKFLTVGWLWYLGMMVPVIGLVQVGAQALADRYTYMPLIGLFIIIAWGAKKFTAKWRHRIGILRLSSVIILIACAAAAGRQVRYWKNSLTLFEHTIQITENNYLILSNYATYLGDKGRFDEALEQFNNVLAMKPDSAEVLNNFGYNLLKAGRINEAVKQLRLAVKYGPELFLAYYNLADALERQGNLEEAVSYYSQAVKMRPDCIDAYVKLAAISTRLNKPYETINLCNKILGYDSNNIFAHGYLGMAFAAVDKTDEAIKEIRFVLNTRPDDIEMHRNLGILLEKKGQTAEAIKSYRTALQIDPDNASARQLLENALKKQQVP